MTKEIKVDCTVYYTVEADSNDEAVKQVKQLVAEELNGNISDWAKYEVVGNV